MSTHTLENNGLPEKITIDKNGSNKEAIETYNVENKTDIEIWQVKKYLNSIVEQGKAAFLLPI